MRAWYGHGKEGEEYCVQRTFVHVALSMRKRCLCQTRTCPGWRGAVMIFDQATSVVGLRRSPPAPESACVPGRLAHPLSITLGFHRRHSGKTQCVSHWAIRWRENPNAAAHYA